ncbi:hypothetical protein VTO73DRAFT_9916 [Trametes versicolor]
MTPAVFWTLDGPDFDTLKTSLKEINVHSRQHSLGDAWTKKHSHKGLHPITLVRLGVAYPKRVSLIRAPRFGVAYDILPHSELLQWWQEVRSFFPCMPSVLTVVVRIPEGNTTTIATTLTPLVRAVRSAFPNVEDVYITTAPLSAHSDFTSPQRVDGELFQEPGVPHALLHWMNRQPFKTPAVTWNRCRVVPGSPRFHTCDEKTWRSVFMMCDLDDMWANDAPEVSALLRSAMTRPVLSLNIPDNLCTIPGLYLPTPTDVSCMHAPLRVEIPNDSPLVPGLYLPTPEDSPVPLAETLNAAADAPPPPNADSRVAQSHTHASQRHATHVDVTTPYSASVYAPTAYLWPTSSRYQLLGAIGTLINQHRFPYDTVHSVELELANAELLEPFHPLFLLLSSLRSVSLRVAGPIFLGREMYNRLRMLRSSVTTLGIHYTGPSDPDTSPDVVFVDHIVCGCSGAIQGTSVLPDMSWVQTLLLRLPDITMRPDTLRAALTALSPLLPNLHTVCLLDITTPSYVSQAQSRHAVRDMRQFFDECHIYGPRAIRYFAWGRWMFDRLPGTKVVSFQEWDEEERLWTIEYAGLKSLWDIR